MIVASEDHPDVVAVVTTLGSNVDRLRACLDSIRATSFDGRLAIVVLWNDPRRPVVDLGLVTVLESELNPGFPASLNLARSATTSPYLWIIQDDMTVDTNCLRRLMERITAEDRPAIVSPVMINEQGLVTATSRGGLVGDGAVMDHWYPFTDIAPEEIDRTHELNWVSSSGALIDADAFDAVGGMDASFFPLLWGDVDLGYRLTQTGRSVVLEPTAQIIHERHGSTPSLLLHFTLERNQERFRRKHQDGGISSPSTASRDLNSVIAREASLFVIDFASYAESERVQLLHRVDGLTGEITRMQDEIATLQAANESIMNSRSMRVTKPLRSFGAMVRRIRQR